ncbi:MAG: TadE/TadG family type IV pilus assembly protein [Bryobacteraceae bacterium]
MRRGTRRAERQKGNAIIEFALVISFLVLLLMGTFSVGMTLTKSVQAGVVARDAGAMFMRYVDFTLAQNKDILVRLANGMGMTASGGNGVVIMTQIMMVGTDECAAGGLSTGACPNFNMPVVIKRMTVGNALLYTTTYGNPAPTLIQADGTISTTNYLNESSVRATNFTSVMTLNGGEYAFVSEAYFKTPEIDMPGYRDGTYVYQRNIF